VLHQGNVRSPTLRPITRPSETYRSVSKLRSVTRV